MNLGERVRAFRALRGYTLERLSELSGVEVGTINALENRGSRRSQFAPQLAEALGVSLEVLLLGTDNTPERGPSVAGVAEPRSAYQNDIGSSIVTPKRVTWEAAVRGEIGEELFVLELPDDALSPELVRGDELIWSRHKQPAIGSVVLVRDKFRQLHARKYHQGRRPGHWIAAALNTAHLSFDSVEDGLEVVAVAAWRALP